MIEFSCIKSDLVSALSVTSRTVAVKSPIPAMEGIYIKADSELLLTGYNLETGITVRMEANVKQGGQTVFPARLFFEIAKKLPGETVTVQVDDNNMASIRSGISLFHIKTMDADDYPELPEVSSIKGIHLGQSELRQMISGTMFSVSDNQARPIQTGCLFEITDGKIHVVAVDGYRLSRRAFPMENENGTDIKFVVPVPALREAEKILTDSEEEVWIIPGEKHILFRIGNATIVSRILEGNFIDWRRVIPGNSTIQLTANVAELTESIERVSLIVSERMKSPVRCHLSENKACFETITSVGTARDYCAIAGDGKELEIGFNCRYLLEALRAIPTEEVMLYLSNPLSPIVMTPPTEDYDYTYMVLPVRLSNA